MTALQFDITKFQTDKKSRSVLVFFKHILKLAFQTLFAAVFTKLLRNGNIILKYRYSNVEVTGT